MIVTTVSKLGDMTSTGLFQKQCKYVQIMALQEMYEVPEIQGWHMCEQKLLPRASSQRPQGKNYEKNNLL
jgi:hypothetical protein